MLRNGELVGTRATAEIDREHLMEMMLGRSMGEMYPRWDSKPGEPMLTVKHLRVPPIVQDFNLVAQRGMVICLAGQVGSGAIEVLRALAGLAADATGEVSVMGEPVRLRSVAKSQAAKVQFISEDRAGEGIFLRLSVGQNLVATRLSDHSRLGMLAHRRAPRHRVEARFRGRRRPARGCARTADELSGGNQQKLAFGRSIGGDEPGVLLMNEPTRGVDVGARAEIYRLIRQFCDRGYCLIMASSDIEEVLGMSDIIVSMYRGRQIAIISPRRGERASRAGRHHPPGRGGMSDGALNASSAAPINRLRAWMFQSGTARRPSSASTRRSWPARSRTSPASTRRRSRASTRFDWTDGSDAARRPARRPTARS